MSEDTRRREWRPWVARHEQRAVHSLLCGLPFELFPGRPDSRAAVRRRERPVKLLPRGLLRGVDPPLRQRGARLSAEAGGGGGGGQLQCLWLTAVGWRCEAAKEAARALMVPAASLEAWDLAHVSAAAHWSGGRFSAWTGDGEKDTQHTRRCGASDPSGVLRQITT